MNPDALTRAMTLRVGVMDERCDGCAALIPANTDAEYRLDGAVFCSPRCAETHRGIPLDTKVTQSEAES